MCNRLIRAHYVNTLTLARHLNRNTPVAAYLCSYLVSQSCVSSADTLNRANTVWLLQVQPDIKTTAMQMTACASCNLHDFMGCPVAALIGRLDICMN